MLYLELKKELKAKWGDVYDRKKKAVLFEQAIYKELIEVPGACCRKCGSTKNLTLDHIVPTFLLLCFGIDTEREILEENCQVLCRMCNQFKSNRLDFSIPETKPLLLKLIEQI